MKIGMITDSLGARSFGELLGTAAHPGLGAGHPMDAANDWQDPDAALGASVNYMMLTGYDCGGWQMALAARSRIGSGTDEDFLPGKDRDRKLLCRADPAQGRHPAGCDQKWRLHRIGIGEEAVLTDS